MIFENNILSRIFVSLYFKHPEFWRLCGRRKQNDTSSLLELCENAHGTNLSTLINGIEWSQIMFKKVKKNISEVNVQRANVQMCILHDTSTFEQESKPHKLNIWYQGH